jgi:hypothetical protein
MPRRPDTLIYAVAEYPPLGTTLFLGLQQVSLMAIYLVMVGSGYLAPPVISAIYLSPSLLAVKAGGLRSCSA